MKITIANRIRIQDSPEWLKQQLIQDLTVPNPEFIQAEQQGYSTWGIDRFINNFTILNDDSIIVPRGMRKDIIQYAEDYDLPFEIVDQRPKFTARSDIDTRLIDFRPYQLQPIHEVVVEGETEGMIVAPAGSGKTVLGIALAAALGIPTLWITHTNQLAIQTGERLKHFLPSLEDEDIGFIGGGKWKIGNFFTIAMVQTLVRRKDLHKIMNDFGLIVVDEAHHCPASIFRKVVVQFNPIYLIGLTATPYRRDKLERLMFQVMGKIITRITVDDVEGHGGIIMPVVKYKTIDSKRVEINNVAKILKDHIVENTDRNAVIVGDVVREAMAGNYCIVVSDRKVHCEILNELISISWKKTGIATGDYSRNYVQEQVRRFEENEITVLVTTFSLLGEGFDIAFLNRAFIAMPFRAEGKVEQLVGRIQRVADGKNDAIVYDYVDHNIGVLKNQFFAGEKKPCRFNAYTRLGMKVEPF